jgi:RNA polymerase sigma factor (sigma-70 family)
VHRPRRYRVRELLDCIDDPMPDCHAGGITSRRELDPALARLPSEQREVVLLVGLEGMPYESVAQILGVPIGTVRSRLSRGRERLRELMGRDREPEPASTAANTDAAPMLPRTVSRREAA